MEENKRKMEKIESNDVSQKTHYDNRELTKTRYGVVAALKSITLVIVVSLLVGLIILCVKLYFQPDLEYMLKGVSRHMEKYPHLYDTSFIEDAFPPLQHYKHQYKRITHVGYKRMKHFKIVIAGIFSHILFNIYNRFG